MHQRQTESPREVCAIMERDWEIEDAIWLYLLVSVHQNLSKKETALFHRLLPTIKHRVLNRQRECREPN